MSVEGSPIQPPKVNQSHVDAVTTTSTTDSLVDDALG